MRVLYEVTETAGPKVAGRDVKPGDQLELTEAEARFHEDSRELVRVKRSTKQDRKG